MSEQFVNKSEIRTIASAFGGYGTAGDSRDGEFFGKNHAFSVALRRQLYQRASLNFFYKFVAEFCEHPRANTATNISLRHFLTFIYRAARVILYININI